MSHVEFYVGYSPSAPPGLARFVRRLVGVLLLAAVMVALALAGAQKPFDPGTFEYGVVREFEGVIEERPYPALLVERPGRRATGTSKSSRYLLVAQGKWGAAASVAGLDGQQVVVQGSLIYRGGQTMLELLPGSIGHLSTEGGRSEPALPEDLQRHTLRGEIVDAKCYLGVMKPGRETPHRACAVRCISGGIPPLLVTETETGERACFLLVDTEGRSVNDRVLAFVAEPVEITGRVERHRDRLVLYADPGSIRRLLE